MFKGTEKEKEYCGFLFQELEKIEARHEERREEALEYYGGMSDSCEMELDAADDERRWAIGDLIAKAEERGVSPENLEEIFGDDYFPQDPITSLDE